MSHWSRLSAPRAREGSFATLPMPQLDVATGHGGNLQVREVSSPSQGIARLCGAVKNESTTGAPVRYFFLALRDAFRAYRRSKQFHYPGYIDGRRRN